MFAARDQENLVHGHQQLAAAKPLNQTTRGLQPKTPGNKYAKTPLKIPLNDENSFGGLGGKSVKAAGIENLVTGGNKVTFNKNAFVTPSGPRVRAPLGAKTTNAKAKGFQTPAGPAPGKDLEKTQPLASTRRPKKVTHPEAVKIEVHGDESPLRADVEYAPPKPKDIPYESDDFPLNCIDYEPLKGRNLTRGIHRAYFAQTAEEFESALERKDDEARQKAFKKADEEILKSLEEDWIVGDVPETFAHRQKKLIDRAPEQPSVRKGTIVSHRPPPTLASRNAVSALSSQTRPITTTVTTGKPIKNKTTSFLSRPKTQTPIAPEASKMRHTAALAASRSTIGYNKGRSALSAGQTNTIGHSEDISAAHATPMSTIGYRKGRSTLGSVQTQKRQGGMTRSVSNLSQSSDVTITPARFAQQEELESKKLPWLSAFDTNDEGLEPVLSRGISESMRRLDDDEEEFVMTLGD